jgi:hypothetical protein
MRLFKRSKNRSVKPVRARLLVEDLETRLVPAGIVSVNGGAGNDLITLDSPSANVLRINNDGFVQVYNVNDSTAFDIDAGAGQNTINILSTPTFAIVHVQSSTGTDTVNLGNGSLDGLLGSDLHVAGNGQSTSVALHDDQELSTFYSLHGEFNSVGTVSWGTSVALVYESLETLTLNGAPGSQYQVNSTAFGTVTRINTSASQLTNQVFVGQGDLDVFKGSLAVFGAGVTNVTLNDANDTSAANYSITQDFVSRSGFQGLVYGGITRLTLDGASAASTYVVTSTAFNTLTTINTGADSDAIILGNGSIDNLAGAVVVNGDQSDAVTLDDHSNTSAASYTLGSNSVSPTDFFGGLSYQGIGALILNGGAGADAFAVTATPTTQVTLNGGSNGNTLTGPNANTAWAIDQQGGGFLGSQVGFTQMTILQGGSGNDTFKFVDTHRFFGQGNISGSINGGGGTNIISYAGLTSQTVVNLATAAASRIRQGNTGGFSNIQEFIAGASSTNVLTGANVYSDWIISKANGGKVGNVVFVGFQNLVGGSNVDSFRFLTGGSVSGSVDGGAAPIHQGNWLDYSNLSTAVAVNLQTGAATNVAGGAAGKVARIQNVHAGNGGSTLVGNSQGNILIGGTGNDLIKGGTGRSILIGDAGSDTLVGGSGSDILIGDKTTLDVMTTNDQRALMAIMAEWQSVDSYAVRFQDIDTGTGSGLNGHNKLNFGTTVLDDGAADSVTGVVTSVGADWFFQGAGDTLHNVQTGEHINNT